MRCPPRLTPAAALALLLAPGGGVGAADPEVFPGAAADRAETAALSAAGGQAAVFRTGRSFAVVVNYYRFKRKQAVHVIEEDLAARFRRIGAALEAPGAAPALREEPLVRRFHLLRFGRIDVPAAAAARAWRALARRVAGRVQLIGEGERVTLYRPYVSQRTFEPIDETVIVLRSPGGFANDRPASDDRADRRVRGGAGVARARAVR